jgi:tetratricopeptide (TPR) repeat protein
VDDAFKVTVEVPQLVPSACWNYLCYQPSFAPVYDPNPNPHINEWHNHNPPPGTVYDLHPRLNHPSLIDRADVVKKFEQMHDWAPWDNRISDFILRRKYGKQTTYEQAMDMFQPTLGWSIYAMRWVASTIPNETERYEEIMLKAAKLDPSAYYDLAYRANRLKDYDKAALYYDKACDNDPNAIRVANNALWRVRYYLDKGQRDKAERIADFAGDVYSYQGLEAKGLYLELTSNYDGALEWYGKIDERYNDSGPVITFCERYKLKTGDNRFDQEIVKRGKSLFPNGKEKVSIRDFNGPPSDGVVLIGQSDLLTQAGLKNGDIIVAIQGIRVHNKLQFLNIRESLNTSELDVIAWQGASYYESRSSPPEHRFGVQIDDFRAN